MAKGPDTDITDACLFIPNDPMLPYWLSSGVIMTNTPNPDLAVVGANTSVVSVQCKASSDKTPCPSTDSQGGATRAAFQLYLAPISLNMKLSACYNATVPGDLLNGALQVGGTGIVTAGGPAVPTTVNWTSQSTDSSQPNFVDPANAPANHKCLVARCFTVPPGTHDNADTGLSDHVGLNPDNTPLDQHYAQHNLTIQAVAGGGAHRILIRTGNATREPELVMIQAVPNIDPNPAVLRAILPGLHTIKGFKQVSNKPLRRVEFDLNPLTEGEGGGFFDKIGDFFDEGARKVITELETKFGEATPGGTQGKVRIPAGHYATIQFIADVTGAQPGNAYLYDLTQVTSAGQPDGGLTVALVAQ